MAFYRCSVTSDNPFDINSVKIASSDNLIEYDSTNNNRIGNENFDCQNPLFTIPRGQSKYIPFGTGSLKLYVNDGFQIDRVRYDSVVSYTYSVHAYDSNMNTYGISIINITYITETKVLIMYNWKTSSTNRSITYSRIIDGTSGGNYMSNEDSTIGASLAYIGAAKGSAYSGRIFKSDFNDSANKLGIVYIRKVYIDNNFNKLNGEALWHGYVACYITTSASFISVNKTLASSLVISCSQTGVKSNIQFGNSNGFFVYSLASNGTTRTDRFYLLRNSGTNVAGVQPFVYTTNFPEELSYSGDDNKAPELLGKLNDDYYVFLDRIKSRLLIYDIYTASTNNAMTFRKMGEINLSDISSNILYSLLPNNILVIINTSTNKGQMYQVTYNGSSYELIELGEIKNVTTDTIVAPEGIFSGQSLISTKS